jgi:hypothetical protein
MGALPGHRLAIGATSRTSAEGRSRARSTTPRGSVTAVEERKAAGVGLGLGEVEQADAGRLQQHLHDQRLGRRGEHDRVDAAVEQATTAGVCASCSSVTSEPSRPLASISRAIR